MQTPPAGDALAVSPHNPERLRKLLIAVALLHILFPLLFAMNVRARGLEEGDWWYLKLVADHFVAGNWQHLYTAGAEALDPRYFWRYPPFALYVVAPLAAMPPGAAYVLLIAIEAVALAWAMVLMARMVSLRGYGIEWGLAIVLSSPFFSVLVTGQSSALLLLIVVAAAWLLEKHCDAAAGALLGLLALKPNWAAFFVLYLLLGRRWTALRSLLLVAAALCASTIPLDPLLWRDFFATSLATDRLEKSYELYKLITLKAFLAGTLGIGAWVNWLWAGSCLGLAACAAAVWRRSGSALHGVGIVLLLAVAANPYASFYDALVLVVPATVWFTSRAGWRRGAWCAVGGLIALAWTGQHVAIGWLEYFRQLGVSWKPPVSLVGPVASVWLVMEAAASARGRVDRAGPMPLA